MIDPHTLKPLDTATVLSSVAKTGRLVAVDPAHRTCSASEISATVVEHGFRSLKAPIARVTAPDVNIPFAASTEKGLYPTIDRISDAIRQTMEGAA